MTSQNRATSAIGGVLFGLVVAAMGGFFVFALLIGYQRAKQTRDWEKTRCIITRSGVAEERPTRNSPMAYRAVIEYRYSFGGKSWTGSSIKRVDGSSSHSQRAESKVAKYPLGRQLHCWVNPQAPEQAILEHNTLAPLYTVWFPGLFVVAGLGISGGALWRARKRPAISR